MPSHMMLRRAYHYTTKTHNYYLILFFNHISLFDRISNSWSSNFHIYTHNLFYKNQKIFNIIEVKKFKYFGLKLWFIQSIQRQNIELDRLKNELNRKNETLKNKEHVILKKNIEIQNINKILEKQAEKNDLSRVMSEWKLKRLENEKEVSKKKITLKYLKVLKIIHK